MSGEAPTQTKGRTSNVNGVATVSDAIALNSTTSVIIALENQNRTFFRFDNSTIQDVWLKLQAAATDDDKKGILVKKNGGFWEMPPDNIYPGEISAIQNLGATIDGFYTEY